MPEIRIGILTSSDTRSRADDTSGRALKELSEQRGWTVVAYEVCADDREAIATLLTRMADQDEADVVFTTGGTGFGPRDVTPEATLDVADRSAPGIAEHIRSESAKVTGRAILSRGVSAIRGSTLIVNLPGSEKAVRESFGFIAEQMEHAVDMMAGGGH